MMGMSRVLFLVVFLLAHCMARSESFLHFEQLPDFAVSGSAGQVQVQDDPNGGFIFQLKGNESAADGDGVLFLLPAGPEVGESSLSISLRVRIDDAKLATLVRRTNGTEEVGHMLYILDSGYVGFRLADEQSGGTIRSSRSIGPADGWVDIRVMWDSRIAEGPNALLDVGGTIDKARIAVAQIPAVSGDLTVGGLQRSGDGNRPNGQYFAGAIGGFELGTLEVGALEAEFQTRSQTITMPPIFSDGAVLQRDMAIPVWGWADPGARVTVAVAGQSHTSVADSGGRWEVTLDPVVAGRGHQLEVSSGVTVILRDVAFGEVWLCSGQSNMEWTMRNTVEYEEELAAVVAANPPIRQFKLDRIVRAGEDRMGASSAGWVQLDPAQLSHFTAVGYHFARAIHEELDVPIGIINSTWGGSQIAPWIPMKALDSDARLKGYADWVRGSHENNRLGKAVAVAETREWLAQAEEVVNLGGIAPNPPRWPAHPIHANRQTPTGMYNGMIAPVAGYGIRGFLWYQGESNRQDRDFYAVLMKSLIAGWRDAWGDDELPYYMVQLAPFRYGDNPGSLPHVQDAQRRVARDVPDTAMAVISDVADLNDIHPRQKREVGRRLARFALANEYGKIDIATDGPVFKAAIQNNEVIRVQFGATGGLTTRDGESPSDFELVDANGLSHAAEARIDGNEVRLTVPQGAADVVAVRFAWSDTAIPTLVSGDGLPASPFCEPLSGGEQHD